MFVWVQIYYKYMESANLLAIFELHTAIRELQT